MTIKELITQLQKLPDTAEVSIFHDKYSGGGDSEQFDDPAIFVNEELTSVFLTPEYYGDYLVGTLRRSHVLMNIAELDDMMGAK